MLSPFDSNIAAPNVPTSSNVCRKLQYLDLKIGYLYRYSTNYLFYVFQKLAKNALHKGISSGSQISMVVGFQLFLL